MSGDEKQDDSKALAAVLQFATADHERTKTSLTELKMKFEVHAALAGQKADDNTEKFKVLGVKIDEVDKNIKADFEKIEKKLDAITAARWGIVAACATALITGAVNIIIALVRD